MAQILLCDLTLNIPGSPVTTQTFGVCNGREYLGANRPRVYETRILEFVNFRRDAIADGKTFGPTEVGGGYLRLANPDGFYDTWLGYGAGGAAVFRLVATSETDYNAATVLLTAKIRRIEASFDEIKVHLQDRSAETDVLFQTDLYAGTNSGAAGVEGLPDDLQGRPVVDALGYCFQAPLPWANENALILQLDSERIHNIADGKVYDGLVGLTRATARASLAALQAASPSAGTFDYYLGGSADGAYIKLGDVPLYGITADIEGRGRTNLLLRSQEFDNASWTKAATTITTNAVTAPDGSTTADKVAETAASAVHALVQTATIVADTVHTFSVFVKAAENSLVQLVLDNALTTHGSYANFNLATGLMTASASYGTGSGLETSITELAEGWFRLSISSTAGTVSTTARGAINTIPSSISGQFPTYAGSAGSGFYVWGAQLETGALTPYVATTTASVTKVISYPGELFWWVWERLGLDLEHLSLSDLSAVDTAAPYDLGIWVDQPRKVREILDLIAQSLPGYWYVDATGTYRIRQARDPSGESAVAMFKVIKPTGISKASDGDIVSLERLPTNDAGGGVPAWQVTVKYKRFAQVTDLGFDNAAAVALRSAAKNEWRTVVASDASIKDLHSLAVALEFETALVDEADAQAVADGLLALYGTVRNRYRVSVRLTAAVAALVDIGTIVRLEFPRFGLDSGANHEVRGIRYRGAAEDEISEIIDLDVWG